MKTKKLPKFQQRLNEWKRTCLTQKLHLAKGFTLFRDAKKALSKGQEHAALQVLLAISESNCVDSKEIRDFLLKQSDVTIEREYSSLNNPDPDMVGSAGPDL